MSTSLSLDQLLAQKRGKKINNDENSLVSRKTKDNVPINAIPSGHYFNEENSYAPIVAFNPSQQVQSFYRESTPNTHNTQATQQSNISIEYRKSKSSDMLQKLAIAPKLDEIVANIENPQNSIISISAPTGSGKSLGIPAKIYLKEANKNDIRILVGEPTRVATYNLYEQEKKILPQSNVLGYAAENIAEYNDSTKLIYMTMGHLKNLLYRFFINGKLTNELTNIATHIMLDEAHTQSLEVSIVLSLINLVKQRGNTIPKIVLLSATPADNLIDIDSNITIKMTSSFTIEKKYHDRNYQLNDRQLYLDAGHKALQLHNSLPLTAGDILVFAPGKSEILLVNQILQKATNDGIRIYLISGEKSQQIINDIYKPTKERKIIVATNLLESAVTIDNLGVIVDTLTEKLSETSYNGGVRLAINNISKSSSEQRAGRTGRTIDGIVYRMCTTDFYDGLPDFRIPEIKRVPLHNAIIELYAHGLPSDILIGAEQNSIKHSNSTLSQLNMISEDKNIYSAKAAGIFASIMPLKVRISRFLWEWLQSFPTRAYEGIVVANLMEYGISFFNIPFKEEGESYRNYITRLDKYKEDNYKQFMKADDLLVMITVFNYIYDNRGLNPKNFKNLKTIATEGGFIYRRVRELIMNIKTCVATLYRRIDTPARMKRIELDFLHKDDLKITKLSTNTYDDVRYILNISAEEQRIEHEVDKLAFKNRVVSYSNSSRRYSDNSGKSFTLDARNTLSTLSLKQPRKLLMIDSFTIQNGRASTNNISFAIIVDKITNESEQSNTKQISAIQNLLKSFTTNTPPTNDISSSSSSSSSSNNKWQKEDIEDEEEKDIEKEHYLLLDEDIQDLFNRYIPQHLLINEILSLFEKDVDYYPIFKRDFSDYLLQLRFDDPKNNNIIMANTNNAYDKLIDNIKAEYGEDYANEFQENWQVNVLDTLDSTIEVNEITYSKNNKTHQYKLKLVGQDEIIVDVDNSFIERLLKINNENNRKAQQQALLLTFCYNMLLIDKFQVSSNLLLSLSDVFNTLVTAIPQNTFINLGHNSVGFFPLLENNFLEEKSDKKIFVLPSSQFLIKSYLTTAYKYLKNDRDSLFIFQDSDSRYYQMKTKVENIVLYQSNIVDVKINDRNKQLKRGLYFLLFSNDDQIHNMLKEIDNM